MDAVDSEIGGLLSCAGFSAVSPSIVRKRVFPLPDMGNTAALFHDVFFLVFGDSKGNMNHLLLGTHDGFVVINGHIITLPRIDFVPRVLGTKDCVA